MEIDIEELFKEIEAMMVLPWEGTLIKTDLTVQELHEKITNDSRVALNKLRNKYRNNRT